MIRLSHGEGGYWVAECTGLSGRVSALIREGGVYQKAPAWQPHHLAPDEPFAQLVVPDHKELDHWTLRAIVRQAGLSVAEFNELL